MMDLTKLILLMDQNSLNSAIPVICDVKAHYNNRYLSVEFPKLFTAYIIRSKRLGATTN